jgi:hypothetical protein
MDMLEGQELNIIRREWQAAGKPVPPAEASIQIGEPSATLGVAELTVAETVALALDANAVTTLFRCAMPRMRGPVWSAQDGHMISRPIPRPGRSRSLHIFRIPVAETR